MDGFSIRTKQFGRFVGVSCNFACLAYTRINGIAILILIEDTLCNKLTTSKQHLYRPRFVDPTNMYFSPFLAVQDSSMGDLVTHSVSHSVSHSMSELTFDISVVRALQSCCRHMDFFFDK